MARHPPVRVRGALVLCKNTHRHIAHREAPITERRDDTGRDHVSPDGGAPGAPAVLTLIVVKA